MFSHESMENLLDNLENELTEVIALDNPTKILTTVEAEIEKMPPVPTKRNFESLEDLSEARSHPVPAARRLQSLDKKEKNDENEIIQLSSMSSSSASENHKNFSQSTVVKASERRKGSRAEVLKETDEILTQETFFVVKHGKWAQEEDKVLTEEDLSEVSESHFKVPAPAVESSQPKLEIVSETPKRMSKKILRQISSTSSCTSAFKTSVDSSSESTSSSEESVKVKKKSKQRKDKKKKKSKKKSSSEDPVTSTETSVKEDEVKNEQSQSIGIFLHSTGTLKYEDNLKSPRVKVSLYNEDSGKPIGDSKLSKSGTFNDDFYNLVCTWNELLVIDQDFKRLKEIYNNVLMFFEVINSEGVTICWAFMKLFSSHFSNIDDKFQLQFFEHQKINKKHFFSNFRKNQNPNDCGVFEQWRSTEKRKFSGVLNVTVRVFAKKKEVEVIKAEEPEEKKLQLDGINRKWQKIPGQACKVPNKTINKIFFHEKGSMNAKFSQDGNFLAFTEVTKDGSILHVHKFPEMLEVFTMLEHSDLIHDIDWLKQKKTTDLCHWMLSGSSDFTAIVWKLGESCYTYHILPHPSFVYASKFLQNDDSSRITVVTAGRDSTVRIWQNRKKLDGYELTQELKHPNINKSVYITAITTRNADTFYTANSQGEVIEWTLKSSKDYHLNRHFKLDEIAGKIVTSLELHPRGSKIFIRVQDFNNSDVSGSIFVLGVPTGLITQKHQQPSVQNEPQGKLKVTSCGTLLFSSNGSVIRFYSLQNGSLTSVLARNYLNIKITSCEKISSMDYHPKDFYFVCAVYGRNGGIIVCNYESETQDKDLFEKLKLEPAEIVKKPQFFKASGTQFSDIIRKLDEVFLAPVDSDVSKRQEMISKQDDNTLTVDSKRSRTYTVSQGPATYTIQKNQNNTYEIPRKDDSDDDDTTISESLN